MEQERDGCIKASSAAMKNLVCGGKGGGELRDKCRCYCRQKPAGKFMWKNAENEIQ